MRFGDTLLPQKDELQVWLSNYFRVVATNREILSVGIQTFPEKKWKPARSKTEKSFTKNVRSNIIVEKILHSHGNKF